MKTAKKTKNSKTSKISKNKPKAAKEKKIAFEDDEESSEKKSTESKGKDEDADVPAKPAKGIGKIKCPMCKDEIEFDYNQYEEGDFFKCPECEELLTVEIKGGKARLVTDQEKKFEEMEEIGEELESEEDDE